MKVFRRLASVIVALCVPLMMSTAAYAEGEVLQETVVATPFIAQMTYEASVMLRTMGRAGAATAETAKGIVHEILYTDKYNLLHLFDPNKTARLTENSIDATADIVVTDRWGHIIEQLQLKDTPNSMPNTVSQVASGKYDGTTLVGTTETAEKFNAAASQKGIEQTMKSSGISTETTSSVAKKLFGEIPTEELLKATGDAAVVGAIIGGATEAIVCYLNGEDCFEITGGAVEGVLKGGAAGGGAKLAATAAAVGFGAIDAAPAVIIIAPVAVGAGTFFLIEYGADKLTDNFDVKENIANAVEKAAGAISDGMAVTGQKIDEWEIAEKTNDFLESGKNIFVNGFGKMKAR